MKEQAKATNRKMAEHLKILRQDSNMTMRQLADELNTPHAFVGKIEHQERRLDVGEFISYCRGVKAEPTEVLKQIMTL